MQEFTYSQCVFSNIAPVVIYSLSKEGNITSLNPAFEKLTGWKSSKWLGKSFKRFIHPEDLPLAMDTFNRVLKGETIEKYELRVLSKSGTYLTGEFTSMPFEKNGEIIGEFGMVCDITKRKLADQALKESENKYKTIFENTGTAIVISEKNGTITLVNTEFEKLSGYKKEEIEGRKNWIEFIPPEEL